MTEMKHNAFILKFNRITIKRCGGDTEPFPSAVITVTVRVAYPRGKIGLTHNKERQRKSSIMIRIFKRNVQTLSC